MAKNSFFINAFLALFIFLLPWQTSLIWHQAYLNGDVWEYGRLSLFLSELCLWAFLIVLAIYSWTNFSIKNFCNWHNWFPTGDKVRFFGYWLAVVFLLLAGISTIYAYNFSLAYHWWIRILALGALFATLLVNKISFSVFAWAWIISSVVQASMAIWQFLNQYIKAAKWLGIAEHFSSASGSIVLQTDSERWLRAYGSLPHPNILGGMMFVGLMLGFYLGFSVQKNFQRWLLLLVTPLMTSALFFSFSRSAWIALGWGIIFWWLIILKNKNWLGIKKFLPMLLAVLLMAAILVILWWGAVTTRVTADQNLELASLQLRATFIDQSLAIFWQLPWWGTGLGNYTLGVYYLIVDDFPGRYYQPVHNLGLLILAELGILAAAVWLLWVGVLLYAGFRKLNDLKIACIFGIFLGFLLIGLVDHYFWTVYVGATWFWIFSALLLKFSDKRAC